MWQLFFVSLGLVFILEGLLPFLMPHFWRQWIQQMTTQTDRTLRLFGFGSMLIGLIFVYLAA